MSKEKKEGRGEEEEAVPSSTLSFSLKPLSKDDGIRNWFSREWMNLTSGFGESGILHPHNQITSG